MHTGARTSGATGTRTPIPAVQEQCSAFELSPQDGPPGPSSLARREGIEPSRREFWRLPGRLGLRRMSRARFYVSQTLESTFRFILFLFLICFLSLVEP